MIQTTHTYIFVLCTYKHNISHTLNHQCDLSDGYIYNNHLTKKIAMSCSVHEQKMVSCRPIISHFKQPLVNRKHIFYNEEDNGSHSNILIATLAFIMPSCFLFIWYEMFCLLCAKCFNRADLRTSCRSAYRHICTILLNELEMYFPMLIPAHSYSWILLHMFWHCLMEIWFKTIIRCANMVQNAEDCMIFFIQTKANCTYKI